MDVFAHEFTFNAFSLERSSSIQDRLDLFNILRDLGKSDAFLNRRLGEPFNITGLQDPYEFIAEYNSFWQCALSELPKPLGRTLVSDHQDMARYPQNPEPDLSHTILSSHPNYKDLRFVSDKFVCLRRGDGIVLLSKIEDER